LIKSELKASLLAIALILMVTGCAKDPWFNDPQIDPQFQLLDPGTQFLQRFQPENRELQYSRIKSGQLNSGEVMFTLRFMLQGPSVDNAPVQASHMAFRQKNLYIAYNTAGNTVAGGFDRINMNTTGMPEVLSVVSARSEYSSVELITDPVNGDSKLIMAGVGLGSDNDPKPQIQIFPLDASGEPVLAPRVTLLNGYVATDVNAQGVVTGTNGGFYEIENMDNGQVTLASEFDDARSIAYDQTSGTYVVLLGNPGRLVLGLPRNQKVVQLGGLTLGETKAIVRIHNGFAIAALGEGGIKVVNLQTGTITGSLDRPAFNGSGNPDDYVSNGLSVDGTGRVFIANGAAGLFVAQLGSDGSIELLGSVNLDASVNFVEASGKYLYAACGAKGVAIIEIAGLPEGLAGFSTIQLGTLTQNTAEIFADIRHDGGESIISRGICWSSNDLPTINDHKVINGSGTGSFSGTMTQLIPNTKYYVRAFATNSNGTAYSEPITFITRDENGQLNSFADPRDGHIYKYVTIGSQTWMAENLAYLPQVDRASTGSASSPAYYVYDYLGTDTDYAKTLSNYSKYGVLYNLPAALEACPPGWHLPTDEEWKQLEQYLGMDQSDSDLDRFRNTGSVGSDMKSISGWENSGNGAGQLFNALPAGFRNKGGTFEDLGVFTGFWSSSAKDLYGIYRALFDFSNGVFRDYWYGSGGFSVRCIKD
jgi:uncharacterized protein (TIGR02145 family)